MKQSRSPLVGTCKLTGDQGKFVRSHLIPAALTRPEEGGAPLIQSAIDSRPIKRWTSWYDEQLVTEAGEAILSSYDDWGIKELQRHRLVWNSWGPMMKLQEEPPDFREYNYDGAIMGMRRIRDTDPLRLRLFFLSLLWQTAATKLKEFSEVELPSEDLFRLKEMILHQEPKPLDFYPVDLIQLSTMGIKHNYSPERGVKLIPAAREYLEYEIPFFRLYLDGLIVHFCHS